MTIDDLDLEKLTRDEKRALIERLESSLRSNPGDEPPGYWKHESSGLLRAAVEAYLSGAPMTDEHIGYMRKYFSQWISRGAFQGDQVERLRILVRVIETRRDIELWIALARTAGCDPL